MTLLASTARARADDGSQLRIEFSEQILPLMKRYCFECHQGEQAEAMLDLSRVTRVEQVTQSHQTWAELRHRVHAGEMPPKDSELQPTNYERAAIVDWIDSFRRWEADRNAGDPGIVPVRRLSNSEMNYSIRDLTGVDMRPTREFPVDPANEAGFDNSADSLTTSPALLNKTLSAARSVAEHLVLTPDGIDFAPHPVVTETDRDKYCVKRIVEFYQSQRTDLAEYFFAAWQIHLAPDQYSMDQAAKTGLSAKYLRQVLTMLQIEEPVMPPESLSEADEQTLAELKVGLGPLAVVRRLWLDLPDGIDEAAKARKQCERLRDFVVDLRKRLEPEVRDLNARGIHKGSQPFVLWKNDQYAAHRQQPNMVGLRKLSPGADSWSIAAALSVPEEQDALQDFEEEVRRFCRIFPDAFYIAERGRDYVGKPKAEQEKGRLLSAGFHSMMGYYRDDEPLMKLMLTPEQAARLDRLWQELDFVTSAPVRQYTGFVWFERTDSATMRGAEFDFARAEDKSVTNPAMIQRLAETYLAKLDARGASETPRAAIEQYFHRINNQIQSMEQARRLAEPHHLRSLLEFANRAFRRDLTDEERSDIQRFYDRLRDDDGLSHEEAIQDVFVSILMSPAFSFRVDLAAKSHKPTPLSNEDLASRLSYFLWCSVPDEELRQLARQGRLSDPATLRAQVKRMLADDRVTGLATEFGGQWLDFRRFEQHNSVDRERFPSFDDALRSAMFQEPIRFLIQVVQRDRSVLDCLHADYLIVNAPLAAHYGIEFPRDAQNAFTQSDHTSDELWQELPASAAKGRGGLLTMAVFLTQNAPGRRTSPVKRGYWVVRRLLGERIPPPPPNVPDLPTDEAQLGTLTLRETLAKHREHESCAGCHNRFDSIGLVFENYGPIGELREKDLAGNSVDTQAVFPSGESGAGIDGLRKYLRAHRESDFVDNLTRKLLSFALGRTLVLSDELLLDEMRANLAANDNRISSLVETIVLSPQFLQKRGAGEFLSQE